uniref:C-type lectin domain-containing protein n=1 Tax=Maylandia zebra TaxID=106582 RepID=A0A3P9BGQ2_9CICH
MACLQTRVPVLRMSMTILMVSLTVGKGLDIKQPDHCRAVCSNYGKPDCITLNQGEVDFKTAEEACHDRKGELLQLCSKSDKKLFDILSQELFGNYWIGLHLPAGACSNLSAPLRGYKWISGRPGITFLPSWNNHIQLCSPHCVSLSSDEKWTERPCLDKADGFLCKVELQDSSGSLFFIADLGILCCLLVI